jgi:hypothetical protein
MHSDTCVLSENDSFWKYFNLLSPAQRIILRFQAPSYPRSMLCQNGSIFGRRRPNRVWTVIVGEHSIQHTCSRNTPKLLTPPTRPDHTQHLSNTHPHLGWKMGNTWSSEWPQTLQKTYWNLDRCAHAMSCPLNVWNSIGAAYLKLYWRCICLLYWMDNYPPDRGTDIGLMMTIFVITRCSPR